MNCYLGFDGGGTKTECIALDAAGNIVGQGHAGPSNPLRVGYEAACAALQLAAAFAVTSAQSTAGDVRAVCAGLAGAGRRNVADEMRDRLSKIWKDARVRIITDAEAALETAVGDGEGVVLIAGTGSIAMGRNSTGQTARAGGYGPWIGDAGSAYDIGRRAVGAVAKSRDLAGPATMLTELVLVTLECADWDEVVEKVAEGPGTVFPRLVRPVMQAADEGDPASIEILSRAGRDLANVALAVIGHLGLKDNEFRVARAGGVFNRSYILDNKVDSTIMGVASRAQISLLGQPPALGAARFALRQSNAQEASRGQTK
ncbi:MAG TPA: BadF/BadG/BcrA/BcrD ATPase family protein [Candidatus Acidoferrales bacterium]|jgi:N-acetylglucosamine kinase-like BadF-type ATPase|nr:BadF/BadG/BcrA/BcrD ATPase family protein [Candidatus Acidoferrales bacterium]